MTFTLHNDLTSTLIEQIGRMNIAAISGGRVIEIDNGIRLPVGYAYSVEVTYNYATDEYAVERVWQTKSKRVSKGKRESVFCDEVGEVAYKASCFQNNDAEYWPEALTTKTP